MRHNIKLPSANDTIRIPLGFCLICGNDKAKKRFTFEKEESNPVAEFAKLAGDVSIVAGYVLNKTRTIEACFCLTCFDRFQKSQTRSQLTYLAFLLTIFFTIVSATLVSSVFGFEYSLLTVGVGIFLAIGFRVYRRYDSWKRSPKIRKLTSKKLVVRIPRRGKYVFEL